MLFPLGKPKFSLFSISLILGKRSFIMAQLSSEELLSITIAFRSLYFWDLIMFY
jgi:hypothetical protein